MKKTIALLIGSAFAVCAADMTVATLYDSQLKMAEGEVVSLAEAMPESAYNFAPTQGRLRESPHLRRTGEAHRHGDVHGRGSVGKGETAAGSGHAMKTGRHR